MSAETIDFARSLPIGVEFPAVLDQSLYRPVPDDWLIAITDVVDSRKAIAAGRYKSVNMAGVGLITAVMNALHTQELPYIFSGDGAAVICSPQDTDIVKEALSKMVAWAREDLDLELRAALIPVSAVREAGFDLLVQAICVSPAITNYAFGGGGLSRAELFLKAGEYAVPAGPAGTRPDLTGLSCRWAPIKPQNGKIVSIILDPVDGREEAFSSAAAKLLALTGMKAPASGSPVPPTGPVAKWPPAGLDLEARATRGAWPLVLRKTSLYLRTLLGWLIFNFKINVGRFDVKRYLEFTSLNTDYRKFQDGLRVTVSLGDSELAKLTAFLEAERAAKNVRYGLSIQDSAILTCYVPSVTSDTHFHFLDGAGGGYAQAAENMKS